MAPNANAAAETTTRIAARVVSVLGRMCERSSHSAIGLVAAKKARSSDLGTSFIELQAPPDHQAKRQVLQ